MFLFSQLTIIARVNSWDSAVAHCLLCLLFSISWELASALKESKAKFDSAGVKLIAVGVGTPNKARILAERVPFLPINSCHWQTHL